MGPDLHLAVQWSVHRALVRDCEEPLSRGGEDSDFDYSYGQDMPDDLGDGDLAPGLRVRHPIFGLGEVVQVIGMGAGPKLRIKFERAGVKTIVVRSPTAGSRPSDSRRSFTLRKVCLWTCSPSKNSESPTSVIRTLRSI